MFVQGLGVVHDTRSIDTGNPSLGLGLCITVGGLFNSGVYQDFVCDVMGISQVYLGFFEMQLAFISLLAHSHRLYNIGFPYPTRLTSLSKCHG